MEYLTEIRYDKHDRNKLTEMCQRHGSDKGSAKETKSPFPWDDHNYTDLYDLLFNHCRMDMRHVFELGIGTNYEDVESSMGVNGSPGASLRMWREYFPNAQIVGADIDTRILFKENRIKTYWVDQTSSQSIDEMWSAVGNQKFDIIIDDGLHNYDANICFFENSIGHLREGGIYIIEDVLFSRISHYEKYFSDRNVDSSTVVLHRPGLEIQDNCLIVIRNSY